MQLNPINATKYGMSSLTMIETKNFEIKFLFEWNLYEVVHKQCHGFK